MAKKIPPASKSNANLKDDIGELTGLDDWESDLADFDFSDPTDPTSRKPKSMLRQGLTEALKSTLKNLGPQIFTKTRNKFPNLDNLLNEATNLTDEASYIKNEFVQDITPSLNALKQSGRALNSRFGNKLPNSLHSRLEKIFRDNESDDIRTPSKEESENLSIQSSLEQIFSTQAKYQDEKDLKEEKDRFLDRSLEQFRHGQLSQLLNQIRINTASERLFRKSTFTAYLKKDLELKYKHLFVAKETLATTQAAAKIFEFKLDAIALNTSLPDIQKKKPIESIKSGLEQAMGQRLSEVGSGAIRNLLNRAKSASKDASSGLNMAVSMLGMVSGVGGMMSPAQMAGDLAGSLLASVLGGKIAGKLFGSDGDGGDTGKLGSYGKLLNTSAKNFMPNLGSKLRQLSLESENSILGAILGAAVPPRIQVNNTSLNAKERVDLTRSMETSIVSIMPGYLARILQQVTNIATGSNDAPLMVYDTSGNKFITQREFRQKAVTALTENAEGRATRLGNVVGVLRGAYSKNQNTRNPSEFDASINDINKVMINLEYMGQTIDYGVLLNYVKAKGKQDYDDWGHPILKEQTLRSMFKGVGKSDDITDKQKLKVAELLLKTGYGKSVSADGSSATWVRKNTAAITSNNAVNEFIENRPDFSRQLESYRDSGQLQHLQGLVESDQTGQSFSLNEDAYKRSRLVMDTEKFNQQVNTLTESTRKDIVELNIRNFQNPKFVRAVFSYLIGDITQGNKDVVATANSFKSFAKNPQLLLDILGAISKTVIEKGEDAGKQIYKRILTLKDRPSSIPGFLKDQAKSLYKTLTTESDEQRRLRTYNETLTSFRTSTGKETDDLDAIFGPEENSNLFTTAKPETTSPSVTVSTQGTDKQSSPASRTLQIVDAIKHFESVFIDYVDVRMKYLERGGSSTNSTDINVPSNRKSRKRTIGKDKSTSSKSFSFKNVLKTLETKRTDAANVFNSLISKFNDYKWVESAKSNETINTVYDAIISGDTKIIQNTITENPTIKDLYDKYKKFRDDPEQLREELENVRVTATNKFVKLEEDRRVKEAQEKMKALRDKQKNRVSNISSAAGSVIDGAASVKDQVSSSVASAYSRLTRPKFVDIYSSEILINPDAEPLARAADLESGKYVFKNGKEIPDSYSIGSPVIDPSTKRIVISAQDIRRGIYNAQGKEITKRTFEYKAQKLAEKATKTALVGGLKATAAGIKFGLKAAMFGMGIYGQMYWWLGKLGWNIGKGILKGIFNKDVRGAAWNVMKTGGKGIWNLGRTGALLGRRTLGGLGRTGARMLGFNPEGPKTSTWSEFKNIWGINTPTKDGVLSKVKSGLTSTKNFLFGGDTDEYGNKKGNVLSRAYDGVRSFFRKKTPQEEMADNIKKMAKIASREEKAEKKFRKKLLKNTGSKGWLATVLGIGGVLLTGLISKITGIGGTVTSILGGLLSSIVGLPGLLVRGIGSLLASLGGKIVRSIFGGKDEKNGVDMSDAVDMLDSDGKPKKGGKPSKGPKPKGKGGLFSRGFDFIKDKGSKVAKFGKSLLPNSLVRQGGKLLGKSAGKKIPLLGLGIGGGLMASRFSDGDYIGTAAEALSTALPYIGGLVGGVAGAGAGSIATGAAGYAAGTAASVGIDTWLAYRDWKKDQEDAEKKLARIKTNQATFNDIENADDELQKGSLLQTRLELYGLKSTAGGWFTNNLDTVDFALEQFEQTVEKSLKDDQEIPIEIHREFAEKMGFNINQKLGTFSFAGIVSKISGNNPYQEENELRERYWITWFNKRFLPIFKHYRQGVINLGKTSVGGVYSLEYGERQALGKWLKNVTKDIVKRTERYAPNEDRYTEWVKTLKQDIKKTGNQVNRNTLNYTAEMYSGNSKYKYDNGPTQKPEGYKYLQTPNQNVSNASLQAIGSLEQAYNSNNSKQYTSPTSLYSPQASQNAVAGVVSDNGLDSVLPSNYTPDPNEIGALSAHYESGKRGSAAIGYDRTGGTSYGKFQIASNTGTFKTFVNWCKSQGPIGQEVAQRLMAAGNPNTGSTKGPVPDVWRQLVAEGKIQKLEYEFIKHSHYDAALNKIEDPQLKELIERSKTLKDVLWSTAVQHGAGGASRIFNQAWKPCIKIVDFLKSVYAIRGTKFGSSSASVQASVKNRFKDELSKALGGYLSESNAEATSANGTDLGQDTMGANAKDLSTGGSSANTTEIAASPEIKESSTPGSTVNTVNTDISSTTSSIPNEKTTLSSGNTAQVSVSTPSINDTSTSTANEQVVESQTAKTKITTDNKQGIDNISGDMLKILRDILGVLQKTPELLQKIDTNISSVTTAINTSSEKYLKLYGANSSSSSSQAQPKRTPLRQPAPLPGPQLSFAKI